MPTDPLPRLPSRGPFAEGAVGIAERRLAWLDRRHAVLARNVANADTPQFRPADLRPFAEVMAEAARGGAAADLARTHARHLAGGVGGGAGGGARPDRAVAEVLPDGNAVSLDREALRIAETETAHALAINLHRAFLGMARGALGRAG